MGGGVGDKATELSLARLSTPSLEALRRNIEEELQKTPLYRDFLVIQKLLSDRRRVTEVTPVKVSYDRPANPESSYRPVAVRLGRVTAITAVMKALEEAGRPMNIHELVDAAQRFGFEFKKGAAKPPASALSVYLTKPKGKSPVVSIWVNNKPMWWFRNRPVPGAEVE